MEKQNLKDTGFKLNEAPPRVDEFRRFLRVFLGRGVVVFGLVIILILFVVAIFAPLIAPYDPNKPDIDVFLTQPSGEHWLGADTVGRDTLSRIIFGSRNSLLVSFVALAVAAGAGMTLGLIAGYAGGFVYTVIMRFMDALMTFPMMLLALTIAAVLGGGMANIIIALGVALIPVYARLMCGQTIIVKNNDYVLAAKSLGAGGLRIMLRHIAPNCFPPLIVMMTMQLGATILAEAGLSFLGIGITPPDAAWGAMVAEANRYLISNPILSIAPGVAIMLVVFAFNMVGDGLRDALDPRLRGTF
jgi:ABC-type dipeptide/oligopeptide/nickel transport system permease subunit